MSRILCAYAAVKQECTRDAAHLALQRIKHEPHIPLSISARKALGNHVGVGHVGQTPVYVSHRSTQNGLAAVAVVCLDESVRLRRALPNRYLSGPRGRQGGR